ncbi:hypothetical protein L1987_36371 [Smallanthus sonchifolius]|uniref:Uncharacterized protein n=1 Tax=Smallanthus sonchifolius TaxID=185202 RepID=A0ACB9HD15_9ASTR|nr:hypothetical protein L1987_36371 [Smallanthus sonchifolius]
MSFLVWKKLDILGWREGKIRTSSLETRDPGPASFPIVTTTQLSAAVFRKLGSSLISCQLHRFLVLYCLLIFSLTANSKT